MAVLVGSLIEFEAGSTVNPVLSPALSSIEPELWPPNASDIGEIVSSTYINNLPVTTTPAQKTGTPIKSYVDDFYYRVHIRPSDIALGNVVSTQVTEVNVWNAHFGQRTLSQITGIEEGLELVGPGVLPFSFASLEEQTWQLNVTLDGPPVLDATLGWVFGTETPELHITANRIIPWTAATDWSNGVRERLTYATNILRSPSGAEQRRALRLAPRREFEFRCFAHGRDRQLLEFSLNSWGGNVWALPILPDVQTLSTAVSLGAIRIECDPINRDFRVGGLVMLYESPFGYEVAEVSGIDGAGLDLARPTQQAWSIGVRVYPVRAARLAQQPALNRLTDDQLQSEIRFLIVESSDWPAVMPATTYRGIPVYDQRPDETNDLTHNLQRLMLELDNGSGIPQVTDTAQRAFDLRMHRWLLQGRSEQAEFRSLLYALNGRQAALWVSTHADDLTLAASVTPASTVMDIVNCGYARFMPARPGRRDIRIELNDSTVFYRRITDATEISSDVERVTIDAVLGITVNPADVSRISWLLLCRLEQDAVEIQHETDSEGVASSSLMFRGVRDDEL